MTQRTLATSSSANIISVGQGPAGGTKTVDVRRILRCFTQSVRHRMRTERVRFLILFPLVLTSSFPTPTSAQYTTTVPSTPTPPSGVTSYDAIRRSVGVISQLIEKLDEYGLDLQIRGKIADMGPEIARQMPANGGVLLFAWVAKSKLTGAGQPTTHQLRSIFIGCAGLSRDEAQRRFDAMPRASDYPERRSDPFEELQPVAIWVTAANALTRKNDVRLDKQLHDYKQAAARLDDDWNWLLTEHRFLESRRRDKGENKHSKELEISAAKSQLSIEGATLRSWKDTQQMLISQLRASIAMRNSAMEQEQQRLAQSERDTLIIKRQLDGMAYTRCPNHCTFKECTHEGFKQTYLIDLNTMRSDYASRTNSLNEWRSRLAAQRQAITNDEKGLNDRVSRFGLQQSQMATRIEALKTTLERMQRGTAKESELVRACESEWSKRFRTYESEFTSIKAFEKRINALTAGVSP